MQPARRRLLPARFCNDVGGVSRFTTAAKTARRQPGRITKELARQLTPRKFPLKLWYALPQHLHPLGYLQSLTSQKRLPGVVELGPVMTVGEVLAAKHSDRPIQYNERMYQPTPQELHERYSKILKESKGGNDSG